MSITHVETVEGKTTWTTKERVEILFTAKNNTSFFHQYMGNWDGRILTDSEVLNTALASITIRELDNISFEVTCSQTAFVLTGEKYTLSNTKRSIDDLAKNESPEIYFEFLGNKGSKIAVMGNLYSLGLYSGVIARIDSNRNNEQIGNFQFKRR